MILTKGFNLTTYNIKVPANSDENLKLTGTFFYCESSNQSFNIETDSGSRAVMRQGRKIEFEEASHNLRVINKKSTPLVCSVVAGYGQVEDSSVTGFVTIQNQFLYTRKQELTDIKIGTYSIASLSVASVLNYQDNLWTEITAVSAPADSIGVFSGTGSPSKDFCVMLGGDDIYRIDEGRSPLCDTSVKNFSSQSVVCKIAVGVS